MNKFYWAGYTDSSSSFQNCNNRQINISVWITTLNSGSKNGCWNLSMHGWPLSEFLAYFVANTDNLILRIYTYKDSPTCSHILSYISRSGQIYRIDKVYFRFYYIWIVNCSIIIQSLCVNYGMLIYLSSIGPTYILNIEWQTNAFFRATLPFELTSLHIILYHNTIGINISLI